MSDQVWRRLTASQRVARNARPMSGSAKQSIVEKSHGLRRRLRVAQ
jgi:hypothetical protein